MANNEQMNPNKTGDPLAYDAGRGDSLCAMLREFYNMRMLPVIVIVWAWAIIIIAAAVYSAVAFFRAEQTKEQIMYATVFICCVQFMALIKTFAWQMIHRNSIKRQISHLQAAVAQLSGTS
jgi:hypothetical protein